MESTTKLQKLQSINPANLEVIGEVPCSSDEEIRNKVSLANQAKKPWKNLGLEKRIKILTPLLEILTNKEKEIVTLTTREMGKPVSQSMHDFKMDMEYLKNFLEESSDYIRDEVTFSKGKTRHRIVYEPRGVVACITAWNFPMTNFIWSVIPNLIAGNTVVFKHSEECPLIGKLVEEAMLSLPDLPKGVFSEVYGDGHVGSLLVEQDIDMIWFIGSSATGKKLLEIAGKKHIKAILEMGGSSPAVIFDDVDIDALIPGIYTGRFYNCGQVCDATKRLIVHKSIYKEVIEKLKTHINKIKPGDPQHESTELGPLVAMRQLDLLEAQVQDAINLGAKIITGGKRPETGKGAYYLPTLVADVNRDMRIWKEEVFGPVLPVVSFETEEEAIQLANDTKYGLSANVYTNDLDRAQRVASEIEAGCVDINKGNHWLPCNPFGGHKASGMGVEHGRAGFHELCLIKVIAEG